MMKLKLLLLSAGIILGFSFAHASPLAPRCELLFSPVRELGTGGDGSTSSKTIKANHLGAVEVNAPAEPDEGRYMRLQAERVALVANKMGLATPPHQVNLVPSAQLDILAQTGGHISPHWTDGREVVGAMSRPGGVYEFVTNGCPQCRAYYSASTPRMQQRSILYHVAGHNDMSKTSIYQLIRPSDVPLAGQQLANVLAKAYREYDRDYVALYFQYLRSFARLQDYNGGTFESPSRFARPVVENPHNPPPGRDLWDTVSDLSGGFFGSMPAKPAKTAPDEYPNDWVSTKSVIQALTQHFPDGAKPFEKNLFTLFEQTQRAYPAVFKTKIMNEGWATLMQELAPRHDPDITSAELVQHAQLMLMITTGGFTNPYALGLSGWRNIYKQFIERPEIKNLNPVAQDLKFIEWARAKYANMDDGAWAMWAFDRRWVEKNRYYLYRQTDGEERDWNSQAEQDFITLSRDWKRVRNYIITKYVNAKLHVFPSISLINPARSSGILHLKQEKVVADQPLKLLTAAKTAFVFAQVFKKPVRLDALFLSGPEKGNVDHGDTDSYNSPWWGPMPPGWNTGRSSPPRIARGQLIVEPDGRTRFVWEDSKLWVDDSHTANSLEKATRDAIEKYKTDVIGSHGQELRKWQVDKWSRLAAETADQTVKSPQDMVDFAPHQGASVREFLQLVEKRLRGAMDSAINGKDPVKIDGKGVRLKVLPEIPEFEYDHSYGDAIIAAKKLSPVDVKGMVNDHDFNIDEGDVSIGRGPRLPGDKFGKKDEAKEGQDPGDEGEDGDEDGDGPPGPPRPGPPGPPGDGDGANETDIQIPLELYGELLNEIVELPNMRRTRGDIDQTAEMRRGAVRKPAGYELLDKTLMAALQKAIAIRKAKHLPYKRSEVPIMTLAREALLLMDPTDKIVAGKMETPLPDTAAVLLVNLDLTGSMMGKRIEMAKNLIYNIKALLLGKEKYKKVIVRWIGFDTVARELSEDAIMGKFFGGGTNYNSAIELDTQIFSEYDNSTHNKYLITIGDLETTEDDAQAYGANLRKLTPDLQFAGVVAVSESGIENGIPVIQAHREIKAQWPWIGIAQMRDYPDLIPAIKELFSVGPEK